MNKAKSHGTNLENPIETDETDETSGLFSSIKSIQKLNRTLYTNGPLSKLRLFAIRYSGFFGEPP